MNELPFVLDNRKHLKPHPKGTANRCYTLRDKKRWQGYAILPPEAYLPSETKQARVDKDWKERNKAWRKETQQRRYEVKRDADREKTRARWRRYAARKRSTPEGRAELKRHNDKYRASPKGKAAEKRAWAKKRDKVNAERRERYRTDTEYRENIKKTTLAKYHAKKREPLADKGV